MAKRDDSLGSEHFRGWIEKFGQRVRQLREEVKIDGKKAAPHDQDLVHGLQSAQEELHAAEEELRMQNDQLRESFDLADVERRRYRDLFEFADDGYILTDTRGIIAEANRVAGKLLHVGPEFLVGKPLIRFVSADQHDLFRAELRQLQQTGKTSEMTLRIEPRASASFFAALKASAMTNEGVGISGMRWLMRDVGEQVTIQTRIRTLNEDAQQELRAQALRLEDACRQRDETIQQERAARQKAQASEKAKICALALASHEMRSHLSALLASATSIESDPALPGHLRESLDVIQRNAVFLNRLSGDLLDLSASAAGRLKIHSEQIDAHATVEHALADCRQEIADKALQVQRDLSARNYIIAGDMPRLRHVFWNILRNAIKFSNHGGTLAIASKNVAGGLLMVEISNTGVGIEPAEIGRIFDSYEQADRDAAPRFGSLGLGLAVARALVDAHGGTISAHSDGQTAGATLRVQLPLAIPTPQI